MTSKVAIAQDWMVVEGGSERVALELADLLPTADVYTSFFDQSTFADRILPGRVRTWPFQRVFGPSRRFRSFLPFYPLWFGGLDLRGYEVVVSSSVAFTHAVRTAPDALHVSYVHTPMRYAWDLDTYLGGSSFSLVARFGGRLLRPALQRWDRATAARPNVLIANSESVRQRIHRVWNRDAEVIHPPVAVDEIAQSSRDDGYLLIAARMLAYRRLDLAVAAANQLKRELVLVGDGPERPRLQALAGPTVRFVGRLDRPALLDMYAGATAYLVPGIEDFGIALVEAMAAGKPVVAFRGGGALETVVDGETGTFFDRQTPDSLAEGIRAVEDMHLDSARIRANAERFSTAVFRGRFAEVLRGLGAGISLGPEPMPTRA